MVTPVGLFPKQTPKNDADLGAQAKTQISAHCIVFIHGTRPRAENTDALKPAEANLCQWWIGCQCPTSYWVFHATASVRVEHIRPANSRSVIPSRT